MNGIKEVRAESCDSKHSKDIRPSLDQKRLQGGTGI